MPYDPEHHGPRRIVGPGFHERVYAMVARVPAGSVTTYGAVAAGLGLRSAARQVGYALAALSGKRSDIPWHRVVNSQGRISARGDGVRDVEQIRRLQEEGVVVDPTGRLERFRELLHAFGPACDRGADGTG